MGCKTTCIAALVVFNQERYKFGSEYGNFITGRRILFYFFLYFHLMHHVELFIKEGYFYVRMFIRSIHVRDFRFNQFDEIILKRILSGKHCV